MLLNLKYLTTQQITRPLKLSFLGLLFLFAPKVLSGHFQPIYFDEAVRLALNTHPKMKVSEAKIKSARAAIIQARGGGLPKLNLGINASRSNNPLTVFGDKLSQGRVSFADFGLADYSSPASINTRPAALNSPGYYSNFDTGFIVNIPIFSGGKTVATLKKLEFLLDATHKGNQQAKTELVYSILETYEGVHTANKMVKISQEALQAADDYLKLAHALHQQSITTQSDILIIETYRRSIETTLKATQMERNNQLDAFRILIGQPESQWVPAKSVQLPLLKKSAEALETTAISSNPQLLSMKSNIAAHHASIKAADARKWPQLNLQLRHDWNAKTLTLAGPSNAVMLEMNWELFSSGEQYGTTQQAIAEYQQSNAEFDEAFNQVRLSIRQAMREIEVAEAHLKASKMNVRQTIQVVKDLREKYGQGLVSTGQLLDGQSRLDTAKSQQVMACYKRLLAQAKLLALINQLSFL